jgi:hypothetical protein
MKIRFSVYLMLLLLLVSCSTGKKALQKGDYFSAISKAVERLKSSPENKNAVNVIRDGYPMAVEWAQEEMDFILSSNSGFKWEQAIGLMQQVNQMSDEIRSVPAARKIIGNPKSYTTELNMAYEKAAEERYNAGLSRTGCENTRESARTAYRSFCKSQPICQPIIKIVRELMVTAKELATIACCCCRQFRLMCNDTGCRRNSFYNQVFGYLNNQFRSSGFVNFYSPFQAEKEKLDNPDFIVDMEFFDFTVGNINRAQKEEKVERKGKNRNQGYHQS